MIGLWVMKFRMGGEKHLADSSLRLYSNGIPDGSNILEILDKYESLSETICERCEKLKQMIINYRGWYQCICKSCLIQNENRLLKMPALKNNCL